MENWLTAPLPVIVKTIISCILIFIAILVIVRLYGLRSFAKMSSVDFASTIAVGSILASIAINTDQSLLKGAVALLTIIGFQQLFSFAKRYSDWFEDKSENNPVYLMWEGEVLSENLANTGVTESDLMAKLREANVFRLQDVKAVVFETTGDVSVLHKEGSGEVDEKILAGVVPSPAEI
ncbi:DUF421 domain-containing protein [Neolewinella aurantiaca]|uniref:DUF421 domain-containing protein n=1 Tax=Neolewinella aurantiaca TaxID=2602767 RepID=A0A5C7FF57_9BACT|nr:YetF domain-containing protein [Neolewinella aurantiaca]TXF88225.1 DUF421 domain-containing protein [Neolewinella aurantiaca]